LRRSSLEHHQSLFAASEQKVEKRRLGLKRVGDTNRRPAIAGITRVNKAQGRFTQPLRAAALMIQKQAHGLRLASAPGQQQQGDLPMIKLDALASRTVDGSLANSRTMTQVTGVAFVTVRTTTPKP